MKNDASSGLDSDSDLYTPPLSSRFQPPLASGNEIPRTNVCEQIFAAGGARLVLIAAPAGFGKTTVMRQVRQRCDSAGLPTAWLNLDPADNDVSRFLTGLVAALERLMPGIADEGTAAAVDAGARSVSQVLQRIARHDESFVLFLDDFEILASRVVLTVVRRIIQLVPLGAQVVIGSRNVPGLDLGRMRANGWLLEIDSAQLRFSQQECGEFLGALRQLELPEQQVKTLHVRTEGWAAALWLASLALAKCKRYAATDGLEGDAIADFIARFSGSDTAIADYLAQDVLAGLSGDLRDFLMRTSILDPLNASLCNAVCSRSDSQSLLERLERDNLFLVRIEHLRGQYRYHGLFAEFLCDQLRRALPAEVPLLHRSAARWYESEGRPVPAIEHALATGNLDYALPLMSEHAPRLLSDARMGLLTRWLDGVPTKRLDRFPELRVIQAWAMNFTRGPRETMDLLEGFDASLALDDDSSARLHALKTVLLLRMDKVEDAYALGMLRYEDLILQPGFASSVLATALGAISIIRGHYDEAHEFLAAARFSQTPLEGSFSLILSESIEGAIDLLRGHLRQAIARLRGTLQPRLHQPVRYARGNALGAVLLAEALYETDECDEAERLLTDHLPTITEAGLPDQLIMAHVLMARVVSLRDDYDQAFQWMMELEHLGHRWGLRRVVASAKLERARLTLFTGNSDAARLELESAADSMLWAQIAAACMVANDADTYEIGLLRWQVRSGQAAEAVVPLTEHLECAERGRRARRAIKLCILLAEALYVHGERRKAMTILSKALHLGAGEGFVRSFVDEGGIVGEMIDEWAKCPSGAADGVPNDYIARLQGSDGRLRVEAAGNPCSSTEGLSRKELIVLRLLAEGHSNRNLARQLYLSETTIRTHLRNINTKLRVHSRMQAVAVGRRMGLV